jgi:pyruvate,water dikinase
MILSGGDIASPGIASGPAVLMDENSDLEAFPPGSVLVVPRSSPRFVRVMSKASAIVADMGSATGHMASLAREFHVPAIVGLRRATRAIRAGQIVTVDARKGYVYDGMVATLLHLERSAERTRSRDRAAAASPPSRLLREVMALLLPLTLTDPRSPEFMPENCKTLHDIARFAHEKCYEEMFRKGEGIGDMREVCYFLDVFLPIDLYILDLGGGLKPDIPGHKIKPSHVASTPLCAMLAGMLDRRLPRFGPRPMDLGGFLSIMMRHAMDSPERERTFRDPSYAMISDRYMNYTARVGYHFGVVDSYCGKTPNKNYISLHFRGGAADFVRRSRRARAVAGILREFGFLTDVKGDAVLGRLSKCSQEETARQLEMIGRLLQFARQMDISMISEESVARFREAFLSGDFKMERAKPAASGAAGDYG